MIFRENRLLAEYWERCRQKLSSAAVVIGALRRKWLRNNSKIHQRVAFESSNTFCLWPCSLAVPVVLAGWVYAFCGSYVQEQPKTQPAVVLVLKCLRRRGNDLKYHPTDWEKLGIKPATPGLQDIGLSPTHRRLVMFNIELQMLHTVYHHQPSKNETSKASGDSIRYKGGSFFLINSGTKVKFGD